VAGRVDFPPIQGTFTNLQRRRFVFARAGAIGATPGEKRDSSTAQPDIPRERDEKLKRPVAPLRMTTEKKREPKSKPKAAGLKTPALRLSQKRKSNGRRRAGLKAAATTATATATTTTTATATVTATATAKGARLKAAATKDGTRR
jgi:hypothetical protein